MEQEKIQEKIDEAKSVILRCIGKNGIYADPTRYLYQCWTRDFVIALPTLLDLGKTKIVRKHLENIAKKQSSNGRIPILFADNLLRLILRKSIGAIKKGRISFVLKRILLGELEQLSPWTRDVEALFVIGFMEYVNFTGDQAFYEKYKRNAEMAIDYIENNVLKDNLSIGCDWRDMLERELGDKALLTNNSFLYRAYLLIGENEKAEALKRKINNVFWNGFYYRDHPSTENFDTLGQSLAVLFDIVPKERYSSIINKLQEMDRPFGFQVNDIMPKPRSSEEQKIVRRIMEKTNQYSVIWPFVNGFAIMALLKMGRKDIALKQFEKWNRLDGFFEWYNPITGKGYGGSQQLWSAALYLRVAKALQLV